jgi:hypothetical protein
MKFKKYSTIVTALLFTNVITTAIAGTLIYGSLMGTLPSPLFNKDGKEQPHVERFVLYQDQLPGKDVNLLQQDGETGDPSLTAVTEPDSNGAPFLCFQVEGQSINQSDMLNSRGNDQDIENRSFHPLVYKGTRSLRIDPRYFSF